MLELTLPSSAAFIQKENHEVAENDLIKDASIAPATKETSSDNDRLPNWIDGNAIKAGQEFVRRHFFLIFFTHFISLLLLLSYIPVRMVLLKTRKSHTKDLSLRRYLSTLLHVKLWYESDFSPDGNATLDVIKIKNVHSNVHKRLRDNPNWAPIDLSTKMDNNPSKYSSSSSLLDAVTKCAKSLNNNNIATGNERISSSPSISQLDMIVTQYCFMGLLTSFPEKFGISTSSRKEMEGLKGFSHLWAVIGHLLGIEERFNLCIGDKTYLKDSILNEILLPDLSLVEGNTLVLWKALVSAMSDFVPCLSLHAAQLYIFEIILETFEGLQELYEDASYYDLFCYKLTIILVTNLFQSTIVQCIFNSLLRFAIYVTSWRLHLTP